MSEEAQAQIQIIEIPPPNSNEMVKFIAARMDELFNSLAVMIPFTTGDIMSACLCHMIESGKVGRQGDMAALQDDIMKSVEIAIAHYDPARKERQN